MITSEGMSEVAQDIINRIDKGTYDLNGVTCDANIYKTALTGSTVMIYLYFEDELSGNMSNFKLVSISGNDFAIKPEVIAKTNTKGLLVRFKFEVKEG